MERISKSILEQCKPLVHKLSDLQSLWHEYKEETEFPKGVTPDWAWIFYKLYIHACLHGERETAIWLREEFQKYADPIQKIGYRHTFSYANVLLRRKDKEPIL